jgi:hypothetical protein
MPAAPRTVTGNVAILTGEARAGIRVTFTRTGAGVIANGWARECV